jgi:formate hydrogenlyase transcriptional activator
MAGETCHHGDDVQSLFPRDRDLAELGAQSYLGIPIADSSAQVIGHMAVLDDKPMARDPRVESILRVFAVRAGAELERQRAGEEVRALNARLVESATRARTLLEINNALASNLTQDALFSAIVRAAQRVVPFERSAVFLHEPQRDVLRLFSLEAPQPSPDFFVGLELPVTDSHVGWAFRNRRPLLRRDLEREREYASEGRLFEEGFRSHLIVPLLLRGEPIGTLNVASTTKQRYGEADAEFLQEVAGQVALAVQNMRDYEEIAKLKARLESENVYLREEIRTQHNFEEIVGASPALMESLAQVERVSATDATVLILGETGVGKELFARAVHSRSARRERPLVKVNCGAIPDGLVESELFGHAKGAFTGALQKRTGRFELADGGTLFLDEVGELPLDVQVKLLRVLQEREFEPVGSSRTLRVDVRVIAASNRDLEELVRAGRFRADLLYRLNVFPLRVPALRERAGDVPLLVGFFVTGLAKRLGKPLQGFSRRDMERLQEYPWPGNVRELQNVVERAAIVSQGPALELEGDMLGVLGRGPAAAATIEEVERGHIVSVLRSTRGVVEGPRGAARILGLNPSTLRSRLRKLGIEPRTHDIS